MTTLTRIEIREMILLTLARAQENQHAATLADLARELEMATATLGAEIQELTTQALVTTTGNAIQLTSQGEANALALLRRHRIVERHFTDVLGLDWASAHEQADKLEHQVTPEAEAALAAQLGNPDTCPHGNPIPQTANPASDPASLPLADCAANTQATIVRVSLETPAILHHLATLDLLPNVEIRVENHAPFDGPVLVGVGRAHYALGRELASRIWVRPRQPARIRARHRHGRHHQQRG